MIAGNAAEYRRQIGQEGRLLGLDLGDRTIGVAISDALRMIATPFDTVARTKFSRDAAQLQAMMNENGIAGLVIGLPVQMDGTEGAACQSARQFARNFLALRDVPVLFFDERLSTVAVTQALLDADMSRQKRGKVVDKMAAAYILQNALDLLRSNLA